MTGNILHKKADEEGNLFICFFAFREEKEIMYGKLFVGFSEILSTKKNRGIFKYLIDNHPFYNTM